MSATEIPEWLAYPGSQVSIRVRAHDPNRDEVVVACNPQGLASLVAVLLWLTSFSDHGALSLSALPFVKAEGPLALAAVIAEESSSFQGELIRMDKGQQFEWQVHENQLTAVAVELHRIATSADYIDYFDVAVSPSSNAVLRFEVVSESANGQFAT
jgi:hypothetical protein